MRWQSQVVREVVGFERSEGGRAGTDPAGCGDPLMSASVWIAAPGVGGSGGIVHNGRTTKAFDLKLLP